MSIPHYKISYAQNFEDLVLSGILKTVPIGFYVDVGANHPELDSVTKIFYDRGWSGINVEPNEALFSELQQQRPRDINVKSAVSSQTGSLTLRIYDGLDGLSTTSQETKNAHASSRAAIGYADAKVDVVSLSELFSTYHESGDVHFLKVDVEGMELEVLLGNDWRRFRPWVLCLERAQDSARREAISTYLKCVDYDLVFFDGINDFAVARERHELWTNFSYAQDIILNGVPVNYIFVRAMAALSQR
jgi:FkbM family methyltransferase